jgi:hypothetical protein
VGAEHVDALRDVRYGVGQELEASIDVIHLGVPRADALDGLPNSVQVSEPQVLPVRAHVHEQVAVLLHDPRPDVREQVVDDVLLLRELDRALLGAHDRKWVDSFPGGRPFARTRGRG